MATQLEKELSQEWELLMDKVFESIGLKYLTVKSMLRKNQVEENNQDITVNLQSDDKGIVEVEKPSNNVQRLTKSDFLAGKITQYGRKYGLTSIEIDRLAMAKIHTFEQFVQSSDSVLTNILGKKKFLAHHLIQIREKIIKKIADME